MLSGSRAPHPRGRVPTSPGADSHAELGPLSSRWWPRRRPWKRPQSLNGRARKGLLVFILPSLTESSSPSCWALDRRSLEAVTSPLRGDGMLEPDGSVAAGLGGGAWLIPSLPAPHPQLPGDWGGGGPHTSLPRGNWALGLKACGKAFLGPPGLKAASPAVA